MDIKRRSFINKASLIAGIAMLEKPLASVASVTKNLSTLHTCANAVTIYHTNDLHGKINAAFGELGGINNLKNELARQENHGLLFDAGDFLNSAQSFNEQKKVINIMNSMGYHAATPGNHELANGQAHLATLVPYMNFSLVNCNYDFDSSLNTLVKPYVIINSGIFKVGITGVGHKLPGIGYRDAIESANKIAAILKTKEQCDLVICLSHLGYAQSGEMPDNKKLAAQSQDIDMIVSGHNRKLLTAPMVLRNKLKHEVIVSHAAWDGVLLGRVMFKFSGNKQTSGLNAKYFIPGKAAGETFASTFDKLRAKEIAA